MTNQETYFPTVRAITQAKLCLNPIVESTPLQRNTNLSNRYSANVFLKREDLQIVRSYKIRGAYNKISCLSEEERQRGIVCASAGNHAQGVAYSCQLLGIKGKIYMPATTPKQKIKQVKMFGKENIEVVLVGDTYDEASDAAHINSAKTGMVYIHPFDDMQIIEGQATAGVEILQDFAGVIDYLFLPIGGGGLAAGVGAYFKQISPSTKIIGVEPSGAASMKASIEKGKVEPLPSIDKFVDGAAVQRVGDITFKICRQVLDDIVAVPEGKVCTTILELYNQDAIVVEPAGALSITALEFYREQIAGKNVVCLVSGSNNDITRTEEIKERSLLYEGLKHYFIVRFPQRAGALRDFVGKVLGPNDDITMFEYSKKTNRDQGPALICIELQDKEDFAGLVQRMDENGFLSEYVNDRPDLFQLLI